MHLLKSLRPEPNPIRAPMRTASKPYGIEAVIPVSLFARTRSIDSMRLLHSAHALPHRCRVFSYYGCVPRGLPYSEPNYWLNS